MFTNFNFLRFTKRANNVYDACRNVELCYERVGNGTAIREARYALEMLLDYYICEKGLAYTQSGLAEKINIVTDALQVSGTFTQEFFDEELFNYVREFGNELVHNSETEFSGYPFHREAITVLQALQEIAIALVVDLDVNFLMDVEKYTFSNSYDVFDDVAQSNI